MIRDFEYRKKHRIVFWKFNVGYYGVFLYPADGQNIMQRRVYLGYVIRDCAKIRWIFVPIDRSKCPNTRGDTRCAAIEAAYNFEGSFSSDQKEAE